MGALVTLSGAAPLAPLGLFPVETMWTVTLDSALTAAPAFDARHGYFPLADGRLVARDLASGDEAWNVPFAAKAAPAAGDDLVFAASSDTVTAFRALDGARVWSAPAAGVGEALVWKSGWLLAASREGVLLAFRASDGVLIWRRELAAPPSARLTVAGDRVYVPAGDGRVLALAIETGADVWEHRLGGAAGQVAATDERVYVGSVDNNLYCLDAATGAELWHWRTGGDIVGAPVIDARRLYFVSLDNVLRSLDRSSGAQRWKRALALRPATGPALADGTIVVSGLSKAILAFAADDGRPVGDYSAAGDISAPPRAGTVAGRPLPLLVVASGAATQGTTIVALMRSVEPPIRPVAPLPGLVVMAAPAP